jgi:transcriptional regulator GlxA family with amidase domain
MDPRVRTVVILIEADLCRETALTALAHIVNLSPSHLRHLFKAETGLTPAQYLKRLRMEKAKQLLETTFLSVKVIASQVGIHNLSHFAQDFKKAHGLTPAQHRARFHMAHSAR